MSISNYEYVDGEWRTRQTDVYEVMARARRASGNEATAPVSAAPNVVPEIGVLSRTVFSTPIFNLILPARIRDAAHNDVVFVGEDTIHIKEVRQYGHLQHIAAKSDFNTRISAARVFGEPKGSSKIDIETDNIGTLPPQVIVLTTASRKLVFLWSRSEDNGTIAFSSRSISLPTAESLLDQTGKYLAVDPKSRAIAVASYNGSFILYKTRNMAQWREETIHSGHIGTPITEEKSFRLDGIITHMEFLSPDDNDESHVILLFVHTHQGATKVSCYDWDSFQGLDSVRPRAERVSVDLEDQNPSLVIPLQKFPAFLMVSSRRIQRYNDILSGSFRSCPMEFEEAQLDKIQQPGDSRNVPIWVQWERMTRHPNFQPEFFYLAREDGLVMYLDVVGDSDGKARYAGHFDSPLDTAFTSIDVEHALADPSQNASSLRNPDVLVAAGVMSNGQLNKIGMWQDEYIPNQKKSRRSIHTFDFIESIPNWTPISDVAITSLAGVPSDNKRQRDGLFITNGRASHGAISELRRGLNALLQLRISLPFDGNSVTGISVLDHGIEDETIQYVFLLFSLPSQSYLLRLSRHKDGDRVEDWSDSEVEETGIDLNHETLVACSLANGVSVQMTPTAIRLVRSRTLESLYVREYPSAPLITGDANMWTPWIISVHRRGTASLLEATLLGNVEPFFAETYNYDLPGDPTCLKLLSIGGIPYIFVGTTDSRLLLLQICNTGLALILAENFKDYSIDDDAPVCESVVAFDDQGTNVIVCGMRNGDIISLKVTLLEDTSAGGKIRVMESYCYKIGLTAAQVTRSMTDPTAAFVSCGSDFCRIQPARNRSPYLDIDSVWFTDKEEPGYQQSPLFALAQLPVIAHGQDSLSGYIFAVSGSNALLAQLDYENKWANISPSTREVGKAVPRRLEIGVTPARMIFSDTLKMMVVAITEAREEKAIPGGYRSIQSRIQLVNLDDDAADPVSNDDAEAIANQLIVGEFCLKPYERVYALLEWTYTDDNDQKYSFLIVGTGVRGPSSESGRRLFLQARKNSKGEMKLKLKKEHSYQAPVYSMALLTEDLLVYTTGNFIFLDEWSATEKKWINRREIRLLSAGVYVTASHPFIYVSTITDSLFCFEFIRESDSDEYVLKQVFTDGQQRQVLNHMVVTLPTTSFESHHAEAPTSSIPQSTSSGPSTTLVLISDKGRSLTGLIHLPRRTHQSAAPTIFEASLPRCITRLRRGNIRPPWRRPARNKPIYPAPNAASSHPVSVPGILADDIIGTSTDGTVFAISLLAAPALRLLKFLQNLIVQKRKADPDSQDEKVRDPEEHGSSSSTHDERTVIQARSVDPDRHNIGNARPRIWHVDGDIIFRFIDTMDRDGLERLVFQDTDEDVKRLFRRLGADVVAASADAVMTRDEESPSAEDVALLRAVEQWLGDILMPVL